MLKDIPASARPREKLLALGPAALAAMAALKQALDPDNLLNPGKILL